MDDKVLMGRTCAWCSAAAPVEATACPSCGAAMAQRETIGDLVIPGVTDVRADLLDADGRPMHIPRASPSHSMASGAMAAAMVGGPVGLAAIGGMAVVGAAEYAMAGRQTGQDVPALGDLGRPSSLAADVARRLDAEGANVTGEVEDGSGANDGGASDANDPWRDLDR